jgi:polyvinyl alcohol dehydrogenase (cytochrome)
MSMPMTKFSATRYLGLLLLACVGCKAETPPTGTAGFPAGMAGVPQPGAGTFAPSGGSGGVGVAPGAGGASGMAPVGMAGTGSVVPQGGSGGAGGSGVPMVAVRSNWPTFGGDLAHTRSSPNETMISAANAGELKAAFDIKAPGVTATPTLYQGVIYWADWGGTVHATDLVTREELWTVDRSAERDYPGGYTGSLAVTETTVYAANRNGLLTALDRTTGTEKWEVVLDGGVHTHVWSSPVVVEEDNVLIIGMGGIGTRDNNIAIPRSQLEMFKGFVAIIDPRDGAELFKVETSPAPSGAGVAVWSSAAVDTTRKLAFIGTGNNYYTPVSPYSDSLLAIDYTTGQIVWNEQFTTGDAWTYATVFGGGVDGDVGAAPNLFTINGRDVVGVGEKTGSYHVHDRMTGDPVWSVPLTRGGFQGGVMAPAAYANGVIYVISNNDTASSTLFALNAADGEELWNARLTDPTFGGPAVGNGVVYAGDQAGNVWAFNTMTGAKLWETRVPQGRGGGFSLVDGMLFTGYGFHFSESNKEPLMGGLIAYSLTGSIPPPPGGMMSDCIPETAVTSAPTFTNVYQGVLCPLGCTKVCHSTAAQGELNLDGKAIAYQGLVNAAAKGPPCAGQGTLVVPGNPMTSIFQSKLTTMPGCGVAMPPGGDPTTTPVTPAQLEAVRAWIMAGAPND